MRSMLLQYQSIHVQIPFGENRTTLTALVCLERLDKNVILTPSCSFRTFHNWRVIYMYIAINYNCTSLKSLELNSKSNTYPCKIHSLRESLVNIVHGISKLHLGIKLHCFLHSCKSHLASHSKLPLSTSILLHSAS